MTSEEQFNAWRQQEFTYLHDDLIEPMKTAWLEATRQAYLDAIRICQDRANEARIISFSEDEKGRLAMTEMYEAEECAEAIQTRMEELGIKEK